MAQYNDLNVTLWNSQLNRWKSARKNETEVVLRLSSNMMGNSDKEINFLHKLLLTNKQVKNIRKAFANYFSTHVKLSKTHISKTIQSRGFLGRLLRPLLKKGLPLMKNVIKPLAKSVFIPFGLTEASSEADAGIHKKNLRNWNNNTNNIKWWKGEFLSIILGTLGASLLGNILASKGINRAREGFIRAGYGSSIKNKDF